MRVNNFFGWLFENQFGGDEDQDFPHLTKEEILQLFTDYNSVRNVAEESEDFGSKAKSLIFIVVVSKFVIEKFTPEQVNNFFSYLIKIDEIALAMPTIALFADLNPYIKTPAYLRAFRNLESHFFPDKTGEIEAIRKEAGFGPEETLADEIEEDFSMLSKREIEDLIDQALDIRDFEKVQKLSKYLPESLEYWKSVYERN